MLSEVSRLRRLLTARGDFWDLRWDLPQLQRAWKNEVVTYPPLRGCSTNESSREASIREISQGTPNSTVLNVNIPYAKVYLRDSTNGRSPIEGSSIRRREFDESKRFRIWATVLSLEDTNVRKGSIACSLYIVKGNPLIISSTPLACFASGTESVVVDMKEDLSDMTEVCLQLIITDLGSHVAVPLDELLETCSKGSESERSLTTWDTQSGGMRGTALVKFLIEKEEPQSYADVLEKRKTQKPVSVLSEEPPVNYTNELLGSARTHDDLLTENEVRKSDLIEQANRLASAQSEIGPSFRRKRGVVNHISFAV